MDGRDANGEHPSRLGTALRRIAVDVTPLRTSRDFRRLWFGSLVSATGYQFTLVATFMQMRELTGSPAAVGAIGLVGLVALVIGTLVAGAFVDSYDRRTLLIGAQFASIAASALLLVGALAEDPPVWVVYAGVGLIAATSALDSPTRSAMTPRLVGHELMPAAAALNQVVWNATALVGPALAGLVIAEFDVAAAYLIDLLTYGAMLFAAFLIRPVPVERAPGSPTGWSAVREGFGYLRGRPVLQTTFLIDIIAMVFGMPRALFPFLAARQFHGGARVAGLLFSAPAVGALVGALTTGWIGRIRHQGRAVIIAVVLWGAGITAFGLVGDRLWLALACLAWAGAADVVSAVFRSTILQVSVPDALRGRLNGIHILVVAGGPRLGDLEAGLVAAAFNPTVSVVSGGILCIVGTAVLTLLMPAFWRYHAGEPA